MTLHRRNHVRTERCAGKKKQSDRPPATHTHTEDTETRQTSTPRCCLLAKYTNSFDHFKAWDVAKRGEVPRDDAAGTGARRSFHLRAGEEDYMPDKLGWGESVPFCEREREREREREGWGWGHIIGGIPSIWREKLAWCGVTLTRRARETNRIRQATGNRVHAVCAARAVRQATVTLCSIPTMTWFLLPLRTVW